MAIRTPAGVVLHTGDFKMDQLPLDGRITDLAGFARLGAEGVDLLLSDSTNAEIPGFVTPEREIGPVLDSIFAQGDQGRIIVASLRLARAPGAAGARLGRRARPQGRPRSAGRWCATWASPATSACCASRPGLVVEPGRGDHAAAEQIVLMSTGSQGEPMSALGRMATGDHRHITIAPGDTVVLAVVAGAGQRDRGLPGDQPAVPGRRHRRAQGRRQGARLRSRAGRRAALPAQRRPAEQLHAGARRVAAPARARPARRSSPASPPDRVVLCEDGDVVDLVEGRARIVGHVKSRYVYVDGLAVGDVGESLLTERRILGDGGFIAATVVVDSVTGKVVGGPTVSGEGLLRGPGGVRRRCCRWSPRRWTGPRRTGITDPHQLQQIVRRTVGRWVNDTYRRRPMIVPDRRRGLTDPRGTLTGGRPPGCAYSGRRPRGCVALPAGGGPWATGCWPG